MLLYLIYLIFFLILLFQAFLLYSRKPKKDPFALKEMRVIIECNKCKKKLLRNFKKGDYVAKKIEKCSCSGDLRITKIFYERITKEESKWEKFRKKFE